jgi:citrate synthase
MLHETTKQFMEGFRDNAHPMAMLVSTVAALSTIYPDAKNVHDPAVRLLQIKRLVGKMPSIAAMSYRHMVGFPYVYPDNDLTYTENFMNMLWKMVEPKYVANPGNFPGARHPLYSARRPRAELQHQRHARRGQLAGRSLSGYGLGGVGSFRTAAWRGERRSAAHAGRDRFSKNNIPAYIKKIKEGKGKLMGFGHRVYKNYDPRAKIIKWAADQVFEVTGRNARLEIALELERIALEDEYFVQRKLYPNVDFYSGIMYQAMGFKTGNVYRAVRDSAHHRLADAMAGNADRSRTEDRASAPGVDRT